MCVLQPRQLFARAAAASANELPAECVLRTPEDAAGCLRLLPALPPPAALVCRPAVPPPRVGGSAGGCAGTAQCAARTCARAQRPGSVPGHYAGAQGGALWPADWRVGVLQGQAGFGGCRVRAGARSMLGSCGGAGGVLAELCDEPTLTIRHGSPRDARTALAEVARTEVPTCTRKQRVGVPRARRVRPIPVPRICWILHTPTCRCLPNASLRAAVSWESPWGAAAVPQLGKPSGCLCPDPQRGPGVSVGDESGDLAPCIPLELPCPAPQPAGTPRRVGCSSRMPWSTGRVRGPRLRLRLQWAP